MKPSTSFTLWLRETRLIKAEISAVSEEAAAAKLKALYLSGETGISRAKLGEVEISNSRGVELEVFDLPEESVEA